MYRKFFAFCFVAVFVVPAAGQVEPYDLTVEYMTAPVGIDEPSPRLSWKSRVTEPGLKNVMQTAYHVLVATSPEILASDKGDLWDSGTIQSERSLNVEYAGRPLETSQRCYWKVRVTYNNKFSRYSGVSSWVMGVMRPEDWKAKWIDANDRLQKESHGGTWVWTGDATDLSVAPQGKRYYRAVLDVNEKTADGKPITPDRSWLVLTADDEYKVFINGKPATQTWGHFNDWSWLRIVDVSEFTKPGKNVIAVEVTNKTQGPTGLMLSLFVMGKFDGGTIARICTTSAKESGWTSSAEATEGWNNDPDFKSEKWRPVVEVGPTGCEPWGKIKCSAEIFSPAFRKSFDVGKKVKEATLHITGLGFYEASLNGKRIGNKVLDPMQTRYDKRVLYSTYDMTDSLKQGENQMDVLVGHGWYDVRSVAVWNFDNAPWRDTPRMIAQLEIVYDDGTKQTVVSDETWNCIVSPVLFDCIRQGEFSTTITDDDIPYIPDVWAGLTVRKRTLGKARVVDAPKGKLVAEAVPPSIIAQELKPVKITEPKPGVYVVDFGQNIAGWIRFHIDGHKPNDVIQFKYTERLDKDGNVDMKPINAHFRHRFPFRTPEKGSFPNDMFQIDTFLCRTGSGETFENRFVYHGFQYVEITGLNKAPMAENLSACVIHNDFRTVGKFECSNELFNKIQQVTVWSYKGNFVNGVPTDCPHREKNGWTGDAQLASELAQYNFENTAAYEKWIYDLLDEQQADGNLPGIVPTSGWGYQWGNGPAWDSALCIIPMMLYEYKGDRRILERAYPAMKLYVDYLTSREKEDGLVYHGLSDWCFAKTKTDAVVTSSIYYLIDAEIVSATAKLLGKNDEAKKYADLAEKIKKAYKKVLYKEDGTVANGSQVSQSFPLYYGVLLEESEPITKKLFEAVEKADNHLDVGILGAKSLFHTLSRYGRTDLAMKILNQKTAPGYGDWLQRGATTLWEDWKDGSSRNHIMYGDVSTWFFQTLGGIRLNDGQAFRESVIEPEFPAGIDWVKAEHDSPYGPIKVDWRRDGKKIKLNFTVPVNTKAMYGTERLGSGDYSFEIDESAKR